MSRFNTKLVHLKKNYKLFNSIYFLWYIKLYINMQTTQAILLIIHIAESTHQNFKEESLPKIL